MSQNGPHPHAGALLMDYLLSEEGQRIVVSINRRLTAESSPEKADSWKAWTSACRTCST